MKMIYYFRLMIFPKYALSIQNDKFTEKNGKMTKSIIDCFTAEAYLSERLTFFWVQSV